MISCIDLWWPDHTVLCCVCGILEKFGLGPVDFFCLLLSKGRKMADQEETTTAAGESGVCEHLGRIVCGSQNRKGLGGVISGRTFWENYETTM
jgi:hypothetical protein